MERRALVKICLLGVLDGSIQGAEEGPTLLHHTVEMHLVEKVTLGITEILGAKPGQNRQADILGKQQLQPGLQKPCRAPSLMYRTATLPCKPQSKTHTLSKISPVLSNGQEGKTSSVWCHCSPTAEILLISAAQRHVISGNSRITGNQENK